MENIAGMVEVMEKNDERGRHLEGFETIDDCTVSVTRDDDPDLENFFEISFVKLGVPPSPLLGMLRARSNMSSVTRSP
jgi:hypothetical protein